jgi:hypothetical protein
VSICAPRPGSTRAWLNYRHGLPAVVGFPLPYVLRGYYRQHRQRSRFALSRGTLHYLAVRRITAARCQAMGMRRLRPGVWYSDLAEVMYAQLTAPVGQEWDMGV